MKDSSEKKADDPISSDHRFVFICGLHRSGTSLLFRALREHPSISGFRDTGVSEEEGQHLQTVYLPAKAFGGPGLFGFNRDSYLDDESPIVSSENARRLFSEWAQHWDLSKPFLLEKSPPNLVRTRFLQALFPNSIFVVMLRHPVPVSYSTQKWTEQPLDILLEHWLICHEKFQMDRPHLKSIHIVKYEDLISEPGIQLDMIFRYLKVDPYSVCLEIDSTANSKYFQRWDREDKHQFERLETRMNQFGYSLKDVYATKS